MEIVGEYTTSLKKALSEINSNWEDYDGLVVAGSHNIKEKEAEEIIARIKEYREAGKPIYGECFGHQLCAIEYARNILGIKDATSEEWGTGTFIVKKLKELNVGLKNGESYWNNYYVVNEVFFERDKPKNMFTAQSHPSYQSSPWNPHQLLVNFLYLCKSNVDTLPA